jgi:hypothetical protein
MPPAMRPAVVLFAVAVALAAAGCGAEIGDSCVVSTDCNSSDTQRICDGNSDNGYCTIRGCDYASCPDESECVRFFTGSFSNRKCDPATEDVATDMCSVDELCAIDGFCVTRASEVRYCMRKCSSNDDCRSGERYECRNYDLMKTHGGEPMPRPTKRLCGDGQEPGPDDVCDRPQPFCGQAPTE